MPSRSASSSRVPCRMDPVKWRWRWALGRVRTSRGAPSTSGEELLQPRDALDQVVIAERVGETEVARSAERLAGDDRDLGLLEDVLRQVCRACDEAPVVLALEEALDGRVGVEGALRSRAHQAV